MIITPAGPFNGTTWETTLQLVFKTKFGADGYQHVPATPGDFGIEGFTKHTGLAFQCYCPDSIYERTVLNKKQQDKITKDLNKLKKNQTSLQGILGGTKIKDWCFVTPEIAHNALLTHAQKNRMKSGRGIFHTWMKTSRSSYTTLIFIFKRSTSTVFQLEYRSPWGKVSNTFQKSMRAQRLMTKILNAKRNCGCPTKGSVQ